MGRVGVLIVLIFALVLIGFGMFMHLQSLRAQKKGGPKVLLEQYSEMPAVDSNIVCHKGSSSNGDAGND